MDQLRRVDLGGGGTAHHVYGLGGQRLRKVVERGGNLKLEWIYLGALVIFRRRRRDTGQLRLERSTVHIGDGTGRIAQVDTKTRDDDNADPANPLNAPLILYQYTNHLGSAVLETDGGGVPISYEEYHPYGTTAYRSAKPGFDLSLKRYRFSGKERDEETGLYYFGARYYAPWLGRWTSADPAGFVDGANLFRYSRNSPINYIDSAGLESRLAQFSVEPPEISYTGTKEEVLEHFNGNPVVGTATFVDDETGETTTVPMSVRVTARDATRVTQTGGVNAGREYWQVSDYSYVPGSARILSDPPAEEEDADAGVSGASSGSESPGPADQSAESSTDGQSSAPSAGTAPATEPPGGSDVLDEVPDPNAGASTVATWDAVQRGRYTAGNVARSAEAVRGVRAATQAGDAVRAWETARQASEARNVARVATQGRLSPGGRAMSQAIDAARTFESSVAEYSTRAPGARTPSPTRYAYTVAERVAEGSGRSNVWMSRLAGGGRVLGPLGILAGLGLGARNVYNAPPEERGRVAAGETGNFAGGMAGASLGMSAGVALAGGVSGFLIGLGVIAGPIGWLAIGLGILGGIAGAWAFGNLGRGIGESLYAW
jgi:RHS repeat-associated protein